MDVGEFNGRGVQSMSTERDRSGKRSGAGQKLSERERSSEWACEKNNEAEAERAAGASWNGNGAVSGLNWPLNFR